MNLWFCGLRGRTGFNIVRGGSSRLITTDPAGPPPTAAGHRRDDKPTRTTVLKAKPSAMTNLMPIGSAVGQAAKPSPQFFPSPWGRR